MIKKEMLKKENVFKLKVKSHIANQNKHKLARRKLKLKTDTNFPRIPAHTLGFNVNFLLVLYYLHNE